MNLMQGEKNAVAREPRAGEVMDGCLFESDYLLGHSVSITIGEFGR